jgi:hypothetical protein
MINALKRKYEHNIHRFTGGVNWYFDNYVVTFRTPKSPPLLSERMGLRSPLLRIGGYRFNIQRRKARN